MEETIGKPNTVDEYIARYPQEVQDVLHKIRAVIKEAIPQAEEKISYNMPAYFQNGSVVWFSANKRHIGFYPLTSALEALGDEVMRYKGTKSSLHFPLNKPMPYALIAKIVQVRLAENLRK